MAATDDTGIAIKYAGTVLGGIAAVIASVGGWLFQRIIKKHDEEIASIKEGIAAVDEKLDTKVDKTTWEQNRRESRENVIELHRKIEKIDAEGEKRHRELMSFLLDQSSRRRSSDR